MKKITLHSLTIHLLTPLLLIAALGVGLIGCSAANSDKGSVKSRVKSSVTGNVTERMQFVVDNLITSYNAKDSVNYRRHFGAFLLTKLPLQRIGYILRSSNTDHGSIAKYALDGSKDGREATLTLTMERKTFKVSLSLDENGRLIRFLWSPSFSESRIKTS